MNKKFALDLNKSTSAFRLSLDKAGVPPDIRAELLVVMDVSGSFEHEHEEGTTGILLERFVPLAKVIDPDGKLDLVTFSNGQEEVSASSPEELLEKMAHREAPVSHAVHWLKAEPATAAAEVTRGPDGKVREIREDGWTVDYVDWSREAPDLPHKFTLHGPDAQATVIVGLWRLAPPPPLATAP